MEDLLHKEVYCLKSVRDSDLISGFVVGVFEMSGDSKEIITSKLEYKELVIDKDNVIERDDSFITVPRKLVALKNDKFKNEFNNFINTFQKHQILYKELDYIQELINFFSGNRQPLLLCSIYKYCKAEIIFLFKFFVFVILLGTLKILFGNFISLYCNSYKKLKLKSELQEANKSYETDKFIAKMSNTDVPINNKAQVIQKTKLILLTVNQKMHRIIF
jgi:hypothetical protein